MQKRTGRALKMQKKWHFKEKYFLEKLFFQEFAAILNKKPNIKII